MFRVASFSPSLRQPIKTLSAIAGLVITLGIAATPAQSVPLSFDTMVGTADGSNILGPTSSSSVIYFTDVASENGLTIDARITATLKGDTNFAEQTNPDAPNSFGDAGFIPDYNGSTNGPQDDLGLFYYGYGVDPIEDGIEVKFEFFDGTGDLSGSFTNEQTISSLELAVYEVDGEFSQSELFRAYKSDGLMSYTLGTTEQALVATDQGDSILFEGPGTNYAEDDATGAAILYYELTQELTLDFGSVQTSGSEQNAVFSAIDGDLSLFDRSNFGNPVTVVPVPFSGLLLLSGLLMSALVFRRKSYA